MHTGAGSRRTSGRRLTGLVAAVLVALGAAGSGAPAAGAAPPTTYENPVSRSFADTFADPAILKAKDGAWYSYGTSDRSARASGPSTPSRWPGRPTW